MTTPRNLRSLPPVALESMILMSASAAELDMTTLAEATAGDDLVIALNSEDLLAGSTGNDVLIGVGGNNVLRGEDGDDILISVRGDNVLDGGEGTDRVVYWGGNRADYTVVDRGFGILEVQQSGNQSDFVTNVEEFQFRDGVYTLDELISGVARGPATGQLTNEAASDQSIESLKTGTEGADVLLANQQQEAAVGAGGNDVIVGLGNSNALIGDEGDDLFLPIEGSHLIDGGAGTDTVLYRQGVQADYQIQKLDNGAVSVSSASGTDLLMNVEQLSFRDGMQIIDSTVSTPPSDLNLPPLPSAQEATEVVAVADDNTTAVVEEVAVVEEIIDDASTTGIVEEIALVEEIIDDSSMTTTVVDDNPVGDPLLDDSNMMATVVDDNPVGDPLLDDSNMMETVVDDNPVGDPLLDDSNMMEAVVDDNPVGDPLLDDSNMMETVVDDNPVGDPLLDDSNMMETVVDDNPVGDPLLDDSNMMETVVDDNPVGDPLLDDSNMMETVVDDNPVGDPLLDDSNMMETTVDDNPQSEQSSNDSNSPSDSSGMADASASIVYRQQTWATVGIPHSIQVPMGNEGGIVTLIEGPSVGELDLLPSGDFGYLAPSDATPGIVRFVYQVQQPDGRVEFGELTIEIEPNPAIVYQQQTWATAGIPHSIQVPMGNEGGIVTLIEGPAVGELDLLPNGDFGYLAPADATPGTVRFVYQVQQPDGRVEFGELTIETERNVSDVTEFSDLQTIGENQG